MNVISLALKLKLDCPYEILEVIEYNMYIDKEFQLHEFNMKPVSVLL